MGFFKRPKKETKKNFAGDSSSINAYDFFNDLVCKADKLKTPTTNRLMEFYETVAPLQTATDKLVDAFLDIEPIVKDKNKKEFPEHGLLKDLERPNKYQKSRREFFRDSLISYIVTGDTYAIVEKRLTGQGFINIQVIPTSLITVESSMGEITLTYTGDIDKIFKMTNGYFTNKANPNQLIINYKRPIPKAGSFFQGFGMYNSCAVKIETYLLTTLFNYAFVDNGARPSMLITPQEPLTLEEHEILKKSLTKQISGAKNAGKTIVPSVPVEIKMLTTAMKDMDFERLEKTCTMAIYNSAGIPQALINPDAANFGNYEAGIKALYGRVQQISQNFFDFLTSELMPLYKDSLDKKVSYNVSSIVALMGDTIDMARRTMDTGSVTATEIREIMGRGPIPKGEELLSSVQVKDTKTKNKNS